MSLSVDKNIRLFKVVDPTIDGNTRQAFGVLQGPNLSDFVQITANSSNQSTSQFIVRPPSNIYVGRQIFIKMPVTFTFTGTSPVNQGLLQSGFDAPRAFPLHSIMESLLLKLNNSSVSVVPREIQKAFIWSNTRRNRLLEDNWSLTPTMPDQSQDYSELIGSIRNPLNSYIDSVDGAIPPRGAFRVDGPIVNTGTDATLQYTFTEALQISPLVWERDHELGFPHIRDITLEIVWSSNKSLMWSHDATSPGTSLNTPLVTLGSPSILVKFIEPPLTIPIPEIVSLPLFNITNFKNDKNITLGVFGSGTDITTIISNNIELQSVPSLITVFVKRRDSDDAFTKTSTFLSITNVSISWDSRSGILSSASQEQLYDMSRKNGLNMSWSNFSGQSPFLSGSDNLTIGGGGSVLI
ncbi:hypothetical protein LCGC14_2617890, partial [marine sediment metagenome]